jgi:hypothetical protein
MRYCYLFIALCLNSTLTLSAVPAKHTCYPLVMLVLKHSCFASACSRLADRIVTRREGIDWHTSPYDLMSIDDRQRLELIYSGHLQRMSFEQIESVRKGLGDAMPFNVNFNGVGPRAQLSLTLFDIFRKEQAYFYAEQEKSYKKNHFEKNGYDKLEVLMRATSFSVKLLDVALAETARRIDDEMSSLW